MSAFTVLASVGVLVALLVHGRIPPAFLFTGLAGGYYLTGLLDQRVWLAGYTNPALATLVLLLVVSVVLERAALLDRLADALLKGQRPAMAQFKLTGATAVASAFLNNTAVVGGMLGVIGRQKHMAASRLLLPLSYASVLGGIVTLVGTSTNMVVNSFVVSAGLPALGMFTFAWVGLPVALLCLLTLLLSARKLPVHDGVAGPSTLQEDIPNSHLMEMVIASQSSLINQTLRSVAFKSMFDATVLGIRRGDQPLGGNLADIPLHMGDCLQLVVGPGFANHHNLERNFHRVNGMPWRARLKRWESAVVFGGFGCAIVLATFEWVPLLASLLVLLALMLGLGIVSPAEMRRRFPFDLLLIIGSALGIAQVLESTGAAGLVAEGVRGLFDGYGAFGALVGIYLLTLLLTELVTNNAAAALAFPMAISTAQAFGVDPKTFIMVVAYAASACFLMPFGYQTHLMVYTPGRYRVWDFVRAGWPVSLVYSVSVLAMVPLVFPF